MPRDEKISFIKNITQRSHSTLKTSKKNISFILFCWKKLKVKHSPWKCLQISFVDETVKNGSLELICNLLFIYFRNNNDFIIIAVKVNVNKSGNKNWSI